MRRAMLFSYIAVLAIMAVWTALCVAALLWVGWEVLRIIGFRTWW